MQFLLIDVEVNGTCGQYELHPPHLISVATPCESQNTENVISLRDITKENCIRCIIFIIVDQGQQTRVKYLLPSWDVITNNHFSTKMLFQDCC